MQNNKIRVFGVTSLCKGEPTQRYGSHHLFFFEFDNIDYETVIEESIRLHEEYWIDIYVLQSSKDSYHILTFDILPYHYSNLIGSWVRLESDYPILFERFFDCFLTLRIWLKGKKQPPVYKTRFVFPNGLKKSFNHYRLYQVFCGIPEPPPHYKDNWEYVKLYFASYLTNHNI